VKACANRLNCYVFVKGEKKRRGGRRLCSRASRRVNKKNSPAPAAVGRRRRRRALRRELRFKVGHQVHYRRSGREERVEVDGLFEEAVVPV
jgi:hypothetical protein